MIGAGHNGLACAAYLSRAGLRTIVVERSDRIGGACVTEEPWPGVRMSTAAHSVALFDPAIVADLGLEFEVVAKDPGGFIPLEGGGGIHLWADPRRRAEEIAKASPSDAEGYDALMGFYATAATHYRPLLTYPATKRQVMRALKASGIERFFGKVVNRSVAEVVREHLGSDVMQGYAASGGIIGSAAGPETPGTSYLFLHNYMGTAAGRRGVSGTVRGGVGEVVRSLADAARAAGCEIRTQAEVASVKLEARRAVGVALSSGEEIDASVVCSGADAKRTIGFVAHGALLKEFVEDVDLLPTDGTVVKVNCLLDALPRFEGREPPGPEHATTVTIAPSISYLEEAAAAAADGRPAEAMFCKLIFESVIDPSLAPEGKHTMSVLAQYAPHALAEGDWEGRRDEIGDLVVATIERYAPGLSGLVEERQVLGPPHLEERFGLTGGHIYHGEMLPDWLFDARPAVGWNRHRTPLPGLYLCGASSHPGGGVTGMPGRNAARAVLADRVAAGVRSAV